MKININYVYGKYSYGSPVLEEGESLSFIEALKPLEHHSSVE